MVRVVVVVVVVVAVVAVVVVVSTGSPRRLFLLICSVSVIIEVL